MGQFSYPAHKRRLIISLRMACAFYGTFWQLDGKSASPHLWLVGLFLWPVASCPSWIFLRAWQAQLHSEDLFRWNYGSMCLGVHPCLVSRADFLQRSRSFSNSASSVTGTGGGLSRDCRKLFLCRPTTAEERAVVPSAEVNYSSNA